jgi:uncharacterized protein YacL (UPF0231 family)
MSQSAITEAITSLEHSLSTVGTNPIKDDEEYKYFVDLHELLRQAANLTSELDQLVIDKMDGYDAQKFKEALGL